MRITRNWGRCELGSSGFRDPHVFFEAKAKKKRAARCGLGPLSAEEPPYGPFFVRGGRVEVVKL